MSTHAPDTILRHTAMNVRTSVLCLIACLLGAQTEAQDAPAEKAARQPSAEDRFEIRNLEGWTLYINRDVPQQYPEQTEKTLEHLGWELYQIKLATPALAVCNMQENNAIWIEYQEEVDLSYHPDRSWLIDRGYTIPRDPPSFMSLSVKTHVGDSYIRYCSNSEQLIREGVNPDKLGAVEIRDPPSMLKWALLQQSDVLHELALAYYDRHAAKEDSELGKKIQAAYEQAREDGQYKSVLRFDGQRVPHPALVSERHYFAELMESYFLVNDHYPFIRCELKDQDSAGYALIAGLWEGNPHR